MNTIKLVSSLVVGILQNRKDVTRIFSRQRAKFEGWLKLELAGLLEAQEDFDNVTLEENYLARKRADIAFNHNGKRWLLEMKTPNTNWRGIGIDNKTRPITMNINEIISDINKLQQMDKSVNKMVVLAMGPIPRELWFLDTQGLNFHLSKIEEALIMPPGYLMSVGEYVDVTSHYGIGVFVADVIERR